MIQHLVKQTKKISLACLLALALIQMGCSKDGSDKIWINIVPTSPVVITADFQLYDAANSDPTAVPPTIVFITIAGPWIKFSYNLTNTNTDDPVNNTVTIVALDLYLTAYTALGVPVTGMVPFTVSGVAGYNTTAGAAFPYLAEVGPGVAIQSGNGTHTTFSPVNLYAGDFYASSLPKDPNASTTNPSTAVLRYQVQAVFTGWFGTFDNPQKRFTKTVTFATQ